MSQSKSQNGYMVVTLSKNGKRQQLAVHRLVALTWLQKEDSGRNQVNHKNGDRADNRIANLEWVTHSENSHHRYDVLNHRAKGARGEANSGSKLTEAKVREIWGCRAAGERHKTIAARFGITEKYCRAVCSRKRWGWLDA